MFPIACDLDSSAIAASSEFINSASIPPTQPGMQQPIGLESQPAPYNPDVTMTGAESSHLPAHDDLHIRGMTPPLYTDFPINSAFMDDVLHRPGGLTPELMGQDGLHNFMPTKTPDYSNFLSGSLFQDNSLADNSHLPLMILTPEELSSTSERHGSESAHDGYFTDSGQELSQNSRSQGTSEWQADLVEDDVGQFLQQAASGHLNYMGKLVLRAIRVR